MKIIQFIVFFLVCQITVVAQIPTPTTSVISDSLLRQAFHNALLDIEELDQFLKVLDNMDIDTPLEVSYKAMSKALEAKRAFNPFVKYSNLLEYRKLIQRAFDQDSLNLEIHFLRFSVEYHIPRFLGMSEHLLEDKNWMVNYMSSVETYNVSERFLKYIFYFLKDTGLCKEEEIEEIETKINFSG